MKNKICESNEQMDNSQTIYNNRTLASKPRKTNHDLYSIGSEWSEKSRKYRTFSGE